MIWDITKKRERFTSTDRRVFARPLLRTECLRSSKLIYENPDSQRAGIGRQGLGRSLGPWSSHGISAFVSEIVRACFLSLLRQGGHSGKAAFRKPGTGPSPEPSETGPWSQTPSLQNGEKCFAAEGNLLQQLSRFKKSLRGKCKQCQCES